MTPGTPAGDPKSGQPNWTWPSSNPNPSVPDHTMDPVNKIYGHKHESATDLHVPLPGADLSIGRSYVSLIDPDNHGLSHGWFGHNWQMNIGAVLESLDSGNRLQVTSLATGTSIFAKTSGQNEWLPLGNHEQWIETAELEVEIDSTGTKNYTVYKLTDPGQWIAYFGRTGTGSGGNGATIATNSWKDGSLLKIEDWYGNTKTFYYGTLDHPTQTDRVRLDHITCKPQGGASTDGAIVEFDWIPYDAGTDSALHFRLDAVRAQRHNGSAWVDVQKAEYTYETSTTPRGSSGDLIQVKVSTLVDRGDWHESFTQYRYHTGSYETLCEGTVDGDGDGIPAEGGQAHQLKAIISAEQIEYGAEMYNQEHSPDITLEAYADHLRTLDDDDEACKIDSVSTKVMQLASKIITRYEGSTPHRVLEQRLLSSCGCGSGGHGTILRYKYIANTSGTFKTTVITEYDGTEVNDVEIARRTFYFDSTNCFVERPDDDEWMYLVTSEAIKDGGQSWTYDDCDPLGEVSSGMCWVKKFTYNTNEQLEKVYMPSAVTAYTPSTTTTAASVTTTNTGLIYEYTYDSDTGRLLEQRVNDGNATYTSHAVSRNTWNGTYPWLLDKIEMLTVAGTTTAGEIQTTEFDYTFHNDAYDNRVAWVETIVERELTTENGINGTGNVLYSHEHYDTNGRNAWSRSPDDSLTKREFHASTGAVTKVVQNSSITGLPDVDGLIGTITDLHGDFDNDKNDDGGSLTMDYAYDLLGRVQSATAPGGVTTRYVREMRTPDERTGTPGDPYLALTILPHPVVTGASPVFVGPASVTILNASGRVVERRTHQLTHNPGSGSYEDVFGSGYDYGLDTGTGGLLSKSTVQHHLSGLVKSEKAWHNFGSYGDGSGVYTTAYAYDTLGRLETMTAPSGTITKYVYDLLDRIERIETGTESNNMVIVAEYYYDHSMSGGQPDSGVGNGNLTYVRQLTGEASPLDKRDTVYTYDKRDRLIKIVNPLAPHAYIDYDHLNRPIRAGLFETEPTGIANPLGDRGAYVEFAYNQRGLPYQQRIKIDPDSGSGDFLTVNTWYDKAGRAVASWGPNAPATKSTFDGLGRLKTAYVTDRRGDALPGATDNYDHATSVSDDVVFEQTSYHYTPNSQATRQGLVDLVTHWVRTHTATDSDTGDLDTDADVEDDDSVVMYTGTYYDVGNRPIRTVEYGTRNTNGFVTGTAPTIDQGSLPTWTSSDPEIITEFTYNTRGLLETTSHRTGATSVIQVNKVLHDSLNRTIATIENWKDAALDGTTPWHATNKLWQFTGISSGGSTDPDDDRVTATAYLIADTSGRKIKQIAYTSNTAGQVTEYRMDSNKGATADDSLLASYDLVTKVVYPEESSGSPSEADRTVHTSYNRLGEPRFTKDQNGTKHYLTMDTLGRLTIDKSVVTDSTIDSTINAIRIAYDALGRLEKVASNTGYTDESSQGTIKNALQYAYTELWQVEKVWQQHDGDVVTSGGSESKKVTYAYSTAAPASGANGSNYSRLTSMTYPNGYSLPYGYGAADSPGARASRINTIDIHASGDVRYDYIGLGLPAIIDMAGPSGSLDVMLTRYHTTAGTTSAGTYPGLDRFGRLVKQMWVDGDYQENPFVSGYPLTPPIVSLAYSYDKAGNVLTTTDARPGAKRTNRDFEYGYDELERLLSSYRGISGGTFTHVPHSANFTPSIAWTLDRLGNWPSLITDKDGDGPDGNNTDVTETRTHNDANELTGLDPDGAGSSASLAMTLDKAGNLRLRALSSTLDIRYTHDAWGRLVKVEWVTSAETHVVSEYQYNGLSHRIVKRHDTSQIDGQREPNGLDVMTVLYYSAGWQLLEEHVDTGWSSGFTVNVVDQTIYGLQYIDEVICRRYDSNADGDFTDTDDRTWYHLLDGQFSTVAILDDAAKLIERVSYDPFGCGRHHWRVDVDGDGDVDAADQSVITTLGAGAGTGLPSSSYEVDADLNQDGVVDSTDISIKTAFGTKTALGKGRLTDHGSGGSGGVRNAFGFSGYIANAEHLWTGSASVGAGLYTVRFRHYDVGLGRWIQRDPAGYMDSMNLYGYGTGTPLMAMDPYGLMSDEEWERMMERNKNMRLRHLRRIHDQGNIDRTEYMRWLRYINLDHAGAMVGLRQIQIHQQQLWLNFATDVAVTIGGGVIVSWTFRAVAYVVTGGLRAAGYGIRFGFHKADHPFRWIGKWFHIQWNFWRIGVSKSGWAIRIPLPHWLWYLLKHGHPAAPFLVPLIPILTDEDPEAPDETPAPGMTKDVDDGPEELVPVHSGNLSEECPK